MDRRRQPQRIEVNASGFGTWQVVTTPSTVILWETSNRAKANAVAEFLRERPEAIAAIVQRRGR